MLLFEPTQRKIVLVRKHPANNKTETEGDVKEDQNKNSTGDIMLMSSGKSNHGIRERLDSVKSVPPVPNPATDMHFRAGAHHVP